MSSTKHKLFPVKQINQNIISDRYYINGPVIVCGWIHRQQDQFHLPSMPMCIINIINAILYSFQVLLNMNSNLFRMLPHRKWNVFIEHKFQTNSYKILHDMEIILTTRDYIDPMVVSKLLGNSFNNINIGKGLLHYAVNIIANQWKRTNFNEFTIKVLNILIILFDRNILKLPLYQYQYCFKVCDLELQRKFLNIILFFQIYLQEDMNLRIKNKIYEFLNRYLRHHETINRFSRFVAPINNDLTRLFVQDTKFMHLNIHQKKQFNNIISFIHSLFMFGFQSKDKFYLSKMEQILNQEQNQFSNIISILAKRELFINYYTNQKQIITIVELFWCLSGFPSFIQFKLIQILKQQNSLELFLKYLLNNNPTIRSKTMNFIYNNINLYHDGNIYHNEVKQH